MPPSPTPGQPDDMSVSHIAGPVIRIGSRFMQRCAWCGLDLYEPPPGASRPTDTAGWQEGAVIRVAKGPTPFTHGAMGQFDPDFPPLDLCAYEAPDDPGDPGPPPGQHGPTADYGEGEFTV